MGSYKTILLDGIDQLIRHQDRWNDLWSRSDVTQPTSRAELIAHWHEHFAGDSQFAAILVLDGDQAVAALPLVGRKIKKIFSAGALPNNEWSCSGDLLVDRTADSNTALDTLCQAINRLPWNLLWLENVPIESEHWSLMIDAVNRSSLSIEFHPQYHVGLIDTTGDWDQYRGQWSKNHRRAMSKAAKKLEKHGELDFRIDRNLQASELAERLGEAFRIEDSSWKGEAGSSILKTPGMPEFYHSQAQLLAASNHLELAWLVIDQRPVAFEYAMRSKGVYHSFKVGYDAEFASASPGQLLMGRMLEACYRDDRYTAMDCMGPVSDAVSKWLPETYPLGRIVIASKNPVARAIFFGYEKILPQFRSFQT